MLFFLRFSLNCCRRQHYLNHPKPQSLWSNCLFWSEYLSPVYIPSITNIQKRSHRFIQIKIHWFGDLAQWSSALSTNRIQSLVFTQRPSISFPVQNPPRPPIQRAVLMPSVELEVVSQLSSCRQGCTCRPMPQFPQLSETKGHSNGHSVETCNKKPLVPRSYQVEAIATSNKKLLVTRASIPSEMIPSET